MKTGSFLDALKVNGVTRVIISGAEHLLRRELDNPNIQFPDPTIKNEIKKNSTMRF